MTASNNPFVKTREDHQSETSEDYAEVIYRLSGKSSHVDESGCESIAKVKTVAIARALEVAQPTVTKILLRLEKEGLVCIHPRQFVHLTTEGVELARLSMERHELVVTFLRELGVSDMQAELDAEGVEHHLSEESLDALRKALAAKDKWPLS